MCLRRERGGGRCLTVLVAGLSEGLSLGEDNGYDDVLEGRHVEDAGVLVVLDVVRVRIQGAEVADDVTRRVAGAGGKGGVGNQKVTASPGVPLIAIVWIIPRQ